jgi:hypothetical protein
MIGFNNLLIRLNNSQEKLELVLFPKDEKLIEACFENCYVPAYYANNCTNCYFENVIFTGLEKINLKNNNYYALCSSLGVEISTNDRPLKPVRITSFFTVYPKRKEKLKSKPSGNRRAVFFAIT